jgi:hypothetical protein
MGHSFEPDADPFSGRWGEDGETLLDMTADRLGAVTGTIYILQGPDRYTAAIGTGRFDAPSKTLRLEGHATLGDGVSRPYLIEATLEQGTLHAHYKFGDQTGSVTMKKIG